MRSRESRKEIFIAFYERSSWSLLHNWFSFALSQKLSWVGKMPAHFCYLLNYCKFGMSELLITRLTAVAIGRQFVQNAQLLGRVSQFR